MNSPMDPNIGNKRPSEILTTDISAQNCTKMYTNTSKPANTTNNNYKSTTKNHCTLHLSIYLSPLMKKKSRLIKCYVRELTMNPRNQFQHNILCFLILNVIDYLYLIFMLSCILYVQKWKQGMKVCCKRMEFILRWRCIVMRFVSFFFFLCSIMGKRI